MCGIAGIFNYQSIDPIDVSVLARMCASIAHRGPDDEGFLVDDKAGLALGHRRLSIIDLTNGAQPMSNEDGTVTIVFNGEIYNFRELRQDLEEKGHRFRTKSDTEVIIRAYEEYGEKSFERLKGIFALGIFDKRKGRVVLARDHFGVKPLYYTLVNGCLVFASEIKAILEHPCIVREIDYEALHTFFTFRYNPSPQTLFRGIRKLKPGFSLVVDARGLVAEEPFWNDRPVTNESISEPEAIEEYRRLLRQAVRRQMVSDVPVGLLLSGGIDSGILGLLMQEESQEPIRTFTVGFAGRGDFNELEDARTSAILIGSAHHETVISRQEYFDCLLGSFQFTEEPIAEPTIPALYYVSRLASRHVKVVLAGQGADEPLAGYQRYVGEKYLSSYHKVLSRLPLDLLASVFGRNERLRRAAYASKFDEELSRFIGIHTIFTPTMKRQMFNESLWSKVRDVDEKLVSRLHLNSSGLRDSLSRLLFIDTRMNLSDDLLLFGDKMTMANSIEMRVPFLDIDLIHFLESLPSSMKLRGKTGKYIHKRALETWLPAEVLGRKKRGFATPMDSWLETGMGEYVKRLVNSPESASRNYFDVRFINQMITEHQERRRYYMRQIFAILSFELWHRGFFENAVLDSASVFCEV